MSQPLITQDTGGYETRYPLLLELSKKQFEVQMWHADKVKVELDRHDLLYNTTERQREVITRILPTFRKYEDDIARFWTDVYAKFFQAPECLEGSAVINVVERAVHERFYDKVNQVFGLNDDAFYLSYLDDPIFKDRVKWLGETLRGEDKKLTCLVYGLVEGVSLFSMFALLRSFQANGVNLIKATVSGTKQSANDELLHSEYLAVSFRYYYAELGITIAEDTKYLDALLRMTVNMVDMEMFIIDKLLGKEDFNGVSIAEYKKFVKKLANNYLIKLGVPQEQLPYDVTYSKLEEWFDIQTRAYAEPDFFSKGENKEYEDGRSISALTVEGVVDEMLLEMS